MGRFLISLLALAGACSPSFAQFQGPGPYQRPQTNPYARPVFSPYLNLLRGGANPAVNYFGLVRPEIDFRNNLQSLQQQVNAQYATTAADENAAAALGTGHLTQFNNLSHYFNYQGGAATGTGTRRPGIVTPTIPTGSQLNQPNVGGAAGPKRSEERRVGKECVSCCVDLGGRRIIQAEDGIRD